MVKRGQLVVLCCRRNELKLLIWMLRMHASVAGVQFSLVIFNIEAIALHFRPRLRVEPASTFLHQHQHALITLLIYKLSSRPITPVFSKHVQK